MGRLWDLIEQHRDSQPYPPSYRQIAQRLGVSQSLFDVWKNPRELPSRERLEAIAGLVGVTYATVLDAALDDTHYRIPPSREAADRLIMPGGTKSLADDLLPPSASPADAPPGDSHPGRRSAPRRRPRRPGPGAG